MPVERWSRQQVGTGEYEGDFVLHHLAPLLGSDGARAERLGGAMIVLLNAAPYFWNATRSRRRRAEEMLSKAATSRFIKRP